MKTLAIQNILVPVDFSELSIQAIAAAKDLAAHFHARVHLLHVHDVVYPTGFIEPGLGSPSMLILERQNEKRSLRRLRDMAARLDLSPDDCHMITIAPAYHAICRYARDAKIDLVVMPTHGYRGLKRSLLGSTAERVVQHSPAPVLITRGKTSAVRKILVPVDFSDSSLKALDYAANLARDVGATVMLLHVVYTGYAFTADGYAMYDLNAILATLRKEAEAQMRDFVAAANLRSVPFETAIVDGMPVADICSFAEQQHADLIVSATHGRTGLKHVLIGSVAENVVRHAKTSVLVVPSHAAIRTKQSDKPERLARIKPGTGNGAHRSTTAVKPQLDPLLEPSPTNAI